MKDELPSLRASSSSLSSSRSVIPLKLLPYVRNLLIIVGDSTSETWSIVESFHLDDLFDFELATEILESLPYFLTYKFSS